MTKSTTNRKNLTSISILAIGVIALAWLGTIAVRTNKPSANTFDAPDTTSVTSSISIEGNLARIKIFNTAGVSNTVVNTLGGILISPQLIDPKIYSLNVNSVTSSSITGLHWDRAATDDANRYIDSPLHANIIPIPRSNQIGLDLVGTISSTNGIVEAKVNISNTLPTQVECYDVSCQRNKNYYQAAGTAITTDQHLTLATPENNVAYATIPNFTWNFIPGYNKYVMQIKDAADITTSTRTINAGNIITNPTDNDARRINDLATIKNALEAYLADHGGKLPTTSTYSRQGAGGWDYSSASPSAGSYTFLDFLEPDYLPPGVSTVPIDPANNGTGDVFYGGTGQAYAYFCYPESWSSHPNTYAIGAKLDSATAYQSITAGHMQGNIYWQELSPYRKQIIECTNSIPTSTIPDPLSGSTEMSTPLNILTSDYVSANSNISSPTGSTREGRFVLGHSYKWRVTPIVTLPSGEELKGVPSEATFVYSASTTPPPVTHRLDPICNTSGTTNLCSSTSKIRDDSAPAFVWDKVDNAHDYTLEINSSSNFDEATKVSIQGIDTIDQPTSSTTTTVNVPSQTFWKISSINQTIVPNRNYYWRVKTNYAGGGSGPWSVATSSNNQTFVKLPSLGTLTLSSPADNAQLNSNPTFRWEGISSGNTYVIKIDEKPETGNANFFEPVKDSDIGNNTTYSMTPTEWADTTTLPNRDYQWKVVVYSGTFTSGESEIRSFSKTGSLAIPSFTLSQGWNLIANPATITATAGQSIYGSYHSVYWLDPAVGSTGTYIDIDGRSDDGLTSTGTPSVKGPGVGYWIHKGDQDSATFTPTPSNVANVINTSTTSDFPFAGLRHGAWNMVGNPFNTDVDIAGIQVKISSAAAKPFAQARLTDRDISDLYLFDPTSGAWVIANETTNHILHAKTGAFIKVKNTADISLIIPHPIIPNP